MNVFAMSMLVAGAYMVGALGTAIMHGDAAKLAELFLPALAALVASYTGADRAFRLQREREAASEIEKRRVAANLANFKLIQAMNWLTLFQRQLIDPVPNTPGRQFGIKPMILPAPEIEIDLASIAFLLDSDDPNLVGEIGIALDSFYTSAHAIAERSKLFLDKIQPRMEAAGILHGDNHPLCVLENAAGNLLAARLQVETVEMVESVGHAIEKIGGTSRVLTAAIKATFPESKVISFEKPDVAPLA